MSCAILCSFEKNDAVWHAAYAAEEAVRAKSLLEMNILWAEKTAHKKRRKKLTRHLAEELEVRKRSVEEKRHTEKPWPIKRCSSSRPNK